MITQSQLVEFVFKNMRFLGNIKEKPVKLITSVMHKVESIKKNELAVKAFQKIVDHVLFLHFYLSNFSKNITGVAVVDESSGKLLGNISARDFKAIDVDGKWWSRLFLTSGYFLQNLVLKLSFGFLTHCLASRFTKCEAKITHICASR